MKQPQRIYYIGKRSGEKHDGILTAATEVQPDGTLKIGFAYCLLEECFIRETGRNTAIERMNSSTESYITEFTGHSANDVTRVFNHEIPKEPRPHHWRHRRLANVVAVGLTYLTVRGRLKSGNLKTSTE